MEKKHIDIKKTSSPSFKTFSIPEDENSEEIKKEKKTRTGKKWPMFFLILIAIGMVVVGSYLFLKEEIKKPLDVSDTEIRIVEIKDGEGMRQIAKRLEEEGIIKNEFYFILYVLKTGTMGQLKTGRYPLAPSMSVPRIVQKIVSGDIIPEVVKVTIPEGFKLSQIEDRIKEEFIKSGEKDFKINLSDFKISDFKEKYEFLDDAPANYNLEGYLFPDTYEFPNEQDMTDEDKSRVIIEKMLDNFNIKLNSNLREDIKSQKKTIFQIVTMASILEKEVKTENDRKIVSGIFWKRIDDGRPLESCATIAYILDKDKWRYSFQDTRKESPYNTYLNKGLPIAPISNPGIESIEAAIYPQESDYNYFLNDPETGKTIFSKTIEEHNQNKVKYLQ